MRRPALVLALLVGAIALTAQQATTASNSVPTTTAVNRAMTVNGATLLSSDYTIVSNQITGVTMRLRAVGLTTKTVSAAFGSGVSVACTPGVPNVLDLVTDLTEADYSCLGFTERADRPRPLVVSVS